MPEHDPPDHDPPADRPPEGPSAGHHPPPHHAPTVRMPLPATIPCDQCSGSMHRDERMFVCERCGRSLTVATVSKLLPKPDLTEG